MEKIVDLIMTNLFLMAESVCNKCSLDKSEPVSSQKQSIVPTIRFSNEDKMVEGELFNYQTNNEKM